MALNKVALSAGIKNLALDITQSQGTCQQFADGLANLIDSFVKTGTVTVAPGVAVATTGTALAQTGTTTAPASGTIS